ncbi:hypothetical protein B2G71_18760 [Novosphingobium sp. PC22D]|uniref:hypothetical protein n=1 Tax=Novosphingobium sp. PC22D TaxID=1962403 RepID=UPI000BF01771|nr:hypothetical protein [Novosphingobium sp. PC22D]PEQ11081.1 hypothetical protein B2G71_18760 [Novosphingobium sp. PC22D]
MGRETAVGWRDTLARSSGDAALSLYFGSGDRPDADQLARALGAGGSEGHRARVIHRSEAEPGRAEILAQGLTFDLGGLVPAEPAETESDPPVHRYGFAEGPDLSELGALEIRPGPHLAGAAGMPPVVRTMALVAAILCDNLPVRAVGWRSARTLMEPRYFSRVVRNWIAGGPFPALGLTALSVSDDGTVRSSGLAHFLGQEIQLQAKDGEPIAETMKIAIRVIDLLMRRGPVEQAGEIELPDEILTVEPSRFGKLVLVWRDA